MSLEASFRNCPTIDKDGYAYIVHPLLDGVPRVAPELLVEASKEMAARVTRFAPTLLIAPEAMALPLVAAVSMETGIPFVVARKRAYGLDGEIEVEASTGYSESNYYVNDVGTLDNVVLLDDMLSTGGTAQSVVNALRGHGTTVLGAVFLAEKPGPDDRLDVQWDAVVQLD